MTYKELVIKRKEFVVEYPGFFNQSTIAKFDDGHYLDPWAKWHNKVPADILLVGQDWGDKKYYNENHGIDNDNNPTCQNLMKLFDHAGIKIGSPSNPNKNLNIHFVNVIPFLRLENMQGGKFVKTPIISRSINEFLRPLIEMVKPKTIITLGTIPLKSIISVYGEKDFKFEGLRKHVNNSRIDLNDHTSLFPMFHCGAYGVNINRPMFQQQEDWLKLKAHLS